MSTLTVICRFGQKFVDRVANPKDIILFHRRKLQQASDQRSDNPGMKLCSLHLQVNLSGNISHIIPAIYVRD